MIKLIESGLRNKGGLILTAWRSWAVLAARQLGRLLAGGPWLAAAMLAWVAKRLSMRLRQVSARLSVLLTRLPGHT